MDSSVPIWIDHYGSSNGIAVIDFSVNEKGFTLLTKEVD